MVRFNLLFCQKTDQDYGLHLPLLRFRFFTCKFVVSYIFFLSIIVLVGLYLQKINCSHELSIFSRLLKFETHFLLFWAIFQNSSKAFFDSQQLSKIPQCSLLLVILIHIFFFLFNLLAVFFLLYSISKSSYDYFPIDENVTFPPYNFKLRFVGRLPPKKNILFLARGIMITQLVNFLLKGNFTLLECKVCQWQSITEENGGFLRKQNNMVDSLFSFYFQT